MAWHSGKPADSDFLSVSVQHIRENFAELEPLQPHVDALVNTAALSPHVDALLSSRIVEMGSNSNGTYVRWENGLQVCMAKVEVNFTSTGFRVFPYPAEYFDSPWGGSFAAGPGSFPATDDLRKFTMSTLLLDKDFWEFRVNEVFSETNRPTRLFAIGRWK